MSGKPQNPNQRILDQSVTPAGRPEVSGETPRFLVRYNVYPAGSYQPRHSHQTLSITLLVRGSLQEWADGRHEYVGPWSVVVKPAGIVHADRFGEEGAVTLQVVVPEAETERLYREQPSLRQWKWIVRGAPLLRFAHLIRAFENRSEEEIQATLNDLLADLNDAGPAARHCQPPVWLARIREKIEEEFGESLRIGALADSAGVHPVYLARAYRRFYGTSISQRIRVRRVEAALRRLQGDVELVRAALDCGFSDQSHLCREFKNFTGFTPGQYLRRDASLPPLSPVSVIRPLANEVSLIQENRRPAI